MILIFLEKEYLCGIDPFDIEQLETTKIEWTDRTWNPFTGCTKISPCRTHCYVEVTTRSKHKNGKLIDGKVLQTMPV